MTTEQQIETLLEHLDENKDLVMKELEDNIILMTWVAWGIGAIYTDIGPKEMFEFMKDPDLEELSRRIRAVRTELKDYSGRGYILDSLFTIYDDANNLSSYLNVENQLVYSEAEIRPRTLTYLCTIQFKLESYYKSRKFSDMTESISVWIFPRVDRFKNRIEIHKYEDLFEVDDAKSSDVENRKFDGKLDKMNAYYFFLGNPDEIVFDADLPQEVLKRRILLYLFDALFNLDLDVPQKMKYLEYFNLADKETEKEVYTVSDVMERANAIVKSMTGMTPEQIQNMNEQLQNLEAENEALKRNQESKDFVKAVAELTSEEIEKLKAELAKY